MTLEPTPHLPKEPLDPEQFRRHWVRPDLAAEALGLEEGTIRAWMGQKKVKATRMGPERSLVWFDDVEDLLGRLPTPRDSYEQKEMIRKQASQVTGAITRLRNLLTDTSQAQLFHQIPSFQSPVDFMDGSLWSLAQELEAFRKQLGGIYYERGYRVTVIQPEPENADPDD